MTVGADGQVRRSCSGRLRIPGRSEPNHKDLFGRLREQFGERSIVGVQPFGFGRFELLFQTKEKLNVAVDKGFLFDSARHDIEPVESALKWLSVRYAPFELDQKDFETHLAPYGEVISMEFVYPEEMKPWHNGERRIKFRMKNAVPNFVKIGVYNIHINYAGVTKLCRKCHGNDHMARECQNNNCRRCGKPGHVEVDCGKAVEDIESPESILKIAEKAKDGLLRDLRELRANNKSHVLTLEDEESSDETEEEEETKEDSELEGEESEKEADCGEDGSDEMPELESEEEPEDARELQNLKRKKYLKEKEGKESDGGSTTPQEEKTRRKKMTKQERRKRRQTEERERNRKREREKSSSPTGEEAGESKKRVGEERRAENEHEQTRRQAEERENNNKRQREEKRSPIGEREERTEGIEGIQEEQRREEEEMEESKENRGKSTKVKQAREPEVTERIEKGTLRSEKQLLFFEWGDIPYGAIKGMLNNNFGAGTVLNLERSEGENWSIEFAERRWAMQALKNGIRDGEKVWTAIAWQFKGHISPLRGKNMDQYTEFIRQWWK